MQEITIDQLQEMMETGVSSARTITEQYLARIEKIDRQGPALNSIIEINPDALAIADSLDKERTETGPRSPLHGIPILIKDNIDTADQMMTTAGSLALLGSFAAKDSFVAQRLRENGAVILGKTNLSEWANFRSKKSSSGWSSRGGQTRNPYALDRNPFGSSAGSGVAVSASLCAAAVGTETDGSIIMPSSACSIVGIKPTVGLIGRSGIIPIAHSQDTPGPMARTVRDAAILLGGLTGIDSKDSASQKNAGKFFSDYTQFLDAQGMNRARIGIARNFFGFQVKVDKIFNAAIEKMKQLGAEIIDPVYINHLPKMKEYELELMLFEYKNGLNDYLQGRRPAGAVNSLSEVIAFNENNQDQVMPYFGQDLLLRAEAKGSLREEPYLRAVEECHRLSRTEGIDQVLQEQRLDAIAAPSAGPPCLTDLVNGDHFTGSSSRPAAIAGYPNITVPAGYIFGLPVGISFFSTAYQEPRLIKLAFAFEQASPVRHPPQFLASAHL
ncbi:MAG: amidase [SAR324 cluster bacterium]|nr:amidase [SAR324 cluster bacterium]